MKPFLYRLGNKNANFNPFTESDNKFGTNVIETGAYLCKYMYDVFQVPVPGYVNERWNTALIIENYTLRKYVKPI